MQHPLNSEFRAIPPSQPVKLTINDNSDKGSPIKEQRAGAPAEDRLGCQKSAGGDGGVSTSLACFSLAEKAMTL